VVFNLNKSLILKSDHLRNFMYIKFFFLLKKGKSGLYWAVLGCKNQRARHLLRLPSDFSLSQDRATPGLTSIQSTITMIWLATAIRLSRYCFIIDLHQFRAGTSDVGTHVPWRFRFGRASTWPRLGGAVDAGSCHAGSLSRGVDTLGIRSGPRRNRSGILKARVMVVPP
jgi:hypothetical protein